ncbi:hypothetical protein FA15DRAFT_672654 [Coprinopsis marcescibilis]|uniref:F-box domain-containing protein n=1 Tax=Coprinopsis marcescibilis TaxID=230819 RepID=A0A5C3KM74_COPMA|nr:hypothetical protein FA15DRAFT_672654 [Coprinopsis marcescibilis]
MAPDLPEDLLREILKHVRGSSRNIPSDSKHLLRITSLVSPTFREISQEFLFEKLDLGPMSRVPRAGEDSCLGAKLLSLFTQSPKLATLVKYVDLDDSYAEGVEGTCSSWLHIDNDISPALRYIPLQRIVGFRFMGVDWNQLPPQTRCAIIVICRAPELKTLVLGEVPPGMLDVCGPSIKDLTLCGPFRLGGQQEQQQAASKLTLERLTVNSILGLEGVHFALDPSNRIATNRLVSLNVKTGMACYDDAVIGRLLESCAPSLECFVYRTSYNLFHFVAGSEAPQFDLSKLSALKLLAFRYIHHCDPRPSLADTVLPFLLPLFHTLPSLSPLENFYLHAEHEDPTALFHMASSTSMWDQFDTLFADRSRFPNLKCVRITVTCGFLDASAGEDTVLYVEEIVRKIGLHLRRLTRAGILVAEKSTDNAVPDYEWS